MNMSAARPYHRYAGSAPAGAIVVRLVRAGDEVVGFIRDIEEPSDTDSSYPTEQKPVDQVWRLVENKLRSMPEAEVYVELEAGLEWQPEWGRLQ